MVVEAGFDIENVVVELKGNACVVIRATKSEIDGVVRAEDKEAEEGDGVVVVEEAVVEEAVEAVVTEPVVAEPVVEEPVVEEAVVEEPVIVEPVAVADATASTTGATNYFSMTVAELKDTLTERGESTWGKKKDLVERLVEIDERESSK